MSGGGVKNACVSIWQGGGRSSRKKTVGENINAWSV